MGNFADATACNKINTGEYGGSIYEGWDIAGNANGGYLMSLAARALCDYLDRPDPVSITAHYLKPGRPGAVTLSADTIKTGRTFSTARGTLSNAEGQPLLALLGSFGDLSTPMSEVRRLPGAPDIAPLEDCTQHAGHAQAEGSVPSFHNQVELRLDPRDAGFLTNSPSGEATMRGWFRLRDGEPMSTLSVLTALDAFPPTIFNANLPVAWTPTVELTAHVRARPPVGWVQAQFTSRFISGGMLEEDGELWTEGGELIALSRQLALLPKAPQSLA